MPEDEPFYYVFHHTEVAEFDNINLDSYQITDNQQLHLIIDKATGEIVKNQKYMNFFNDPDKAFRNFEKLEQIIPEVDL